MKKIIAPTLLLFFTQLAMAQSGTKWSVNGNAVTSGDFIGTTNNESLVLKANNTIGLKVKPNGELIFKSLDLNSNAPSGLVLTSGQGVISRLDFNTTTNQVLFSNGTWGAIPTPTFSTHWNTNGTSLYYNNGYVGIGTNAPLFPLDVIGDARITNNLYVGGGVVISDKVKATTEVKGWDIKVENDLSVEAATRLKGATRIDQGFTFDGMNGITMIPSNGTNPKIFRYGNSSTSQVLSNCAAGPTQQAWGAHHFGGLLQIYDADPTTGAYNPNSGLLNFQTWSGGSSIDASIGGQTGGGGLLLNYFCGNNTYINTGANGGTVNLGVTHVGNPLNSSSPHFADAKLTIAGKVVAQSCYVTQSNWADFVFSKDYKLPTLSEIENYYKENKHLPQIPSEKEIKENGVDLGEMNKLLLQKIEELTILMVEQDKRIKQLESK